MKLKYFFLLTSLAACGTTIKVSKNNNLSNRHQFEVELITEQMDSAASASSSSDTLSSTSEQSSSESTGGNSQGGCGGEGSVSGSGGETNSSSVETSSDSSSEAESSVEASSVEASSVETVSSSQSSSSGGDGGAGGSDSDECQPGNRHPKSCEQQLICCMEGCKLLVADKALHVKCVHACEEEHKDCAHTRR